MRAVIKLRKKLICLIALSGLLSGITPVDAQTDLLKILEDYADAMIADGRDDNRYGENTSPLFATMLRRDTDRPEMLPYPQIPPLKEKSEPGHRWLYYTGTNFINIPFLAGEKLHKLTVSGEDVLENYGLYRMLYVLSELTNNSKYKDAADEALTWWYKNTQGPSGLFPWGEHLGWDFRFDYITYHIPGHEDFYNNPKYDYDNTPQEQWVEKFSPITQLYQGFQHEPRIEDLSAEILLENLKNLPLEKGETFTPLEKFAFGCWREHIIDLESGGYNRHGDYFGRRWGVEGRWGGTGNFPRVMGQFFDYWSYTWMHSDNLVAKDSLETIMETIVDYLETEKDTNGIMNKSYHQVYKAVAGIQLASQRIKSGNAVLSRKLEAFANSQVNALYNVWPKGKNTRYNMTLWFSTGREDIKPYIKQDIEELCQLDPNSISSASDFAFNIRYMVLAYQIFKEEKYLTKAEEIVKHAVDKMFDDYSPLPRINTTDTIYAGNGTAFANFYHAPGGSDDLMWALALYAQEAAR
jgi:hypothetical protein